jgi:hypothetical protein
MYKGYPNRNAYRNAIARRDGWASYWHQRQTQRAISENHLRDGRTAEGAVRSRFIAGSKSNPSAKWRRAFIGAYVAIKVKDHVRANDLGSDAQMSTDFRALPQNERPDDSIGESVVYYH